MSTRTNQAPDVNLTETTTTAITAVSIAPIALIVSR